MKDIIGDEGEGKLTGDEVVSKACRTKGELTDERQPWKKPRGKQLRKLSPVETLSIPPTPCPAGRVGESNCFCGARQRVTAGVNAALGSIRESSEGL